MKISSESIIGFIFIILSSMFVFKALDIKKENEASLKNALYKTYSADFSNAYGINIGSKIKISGIDVGEVSSLKLRPDSLLVNVKIKVRKDIKLSQDSIISVYTDGLFGSKYLGIKPGFDEIYLQDGDRINFTRSAINLEEIISKFAAK